jgi:hypothetical protein
VAIRVWASRRRSDTVSRAESHRRGAHTR